MIVRLPFMTCLLAGVGLAVSFHLIPYLRYIQTDDWVLTPCVLEHCELRTAGGQGRRRVSVDYVAATYRYVHGGTEYSSDRVDFVTDFLGGVQATGLQEEEARRYVKSHPAGTRTICYVDPAEPSRAVLLRHRMPSLLSILPALLLFAFGAIGMVAIARASRKMEAGRRLKTPSVEPST